MIYTDFENMEIEKYTEPPSSRTLVPNLFDTGTGFVEDDFSTGRGSGRGWR